MEHIADIVSNVNQVHPIFGKLAMVIMVGAFLYGSITLQNTSFIISICSGSVALAYYIWRWRKEYLIYKKTKK